MDIEAAELCDALQCEIGKLGYPGAFNDLEITFNDDSQAIHIAGEVTSWYLEQLLIMTAQRICQNGNGHEKTNGNGRINGGSGVLGINGKRKPYLIDISHLSVTRIACSR